MKCLSFHATVETFDTDRQRVSRVVAVMQGGWVTAAARSLHVRPIAYKKIGTGELEPRIMSTNKGHLIALQFGGPDSERNMVPMYGQFNKHGAWKRFETSLDKFVTGLTHTHPETNRPVGDRVQVSISCAYEGDDGRVPSAFRVRATGETTRQVKTWTIRHNPPQAMVTVVDKSKRDRARDLRNEIRQTNWRIEDVITSEVLAALNYPTRRGPPILSTDKPRPYAFLDFQNWKTAMAQQGDRAFRAWVDSIMACDAQHFTNAQIKEIRGYNRNLHDGRLISDDENDPAWGGHAVFGDAYLLPGGVPGQLAMAGEDLAPQVDHVMPRSKGGFGIFSNAMVVSAKCNGSKSAGLTAGLTGKLTEHAKRGSNSSRRAAKRQRREEPPSG